MKIIEAIQKVDALKPNSYSQEDKIKWLSTLDGIVKKEIIDTHVGGNEIVLNDYDLSSLEVELLIPAPYDDIYIKWLEAQIDYNSSEIGKYNNSMAMFNSAYGNYERDYNRTHMPIGKKIKYF